MHGVEREFHLHTEVNESASLEFVAYKHGHLQYTPFYNQMEHARGYFEGGSCGARIYRMGVFVWSFSCIYVFEPT